MNMGQRNNSESLWRMEPQTCGFHSLMPYHWALGILWWTRTLWMSFFVETQNLFLCPMFMTRWKHLSLDSILPCICSVIDRTWLQNMARTFSDAQGVGNKKLWNYNIWFYLFFSFFLSLFFPLSLSQCCPLIMLGKDIFKLGKQSLHPFFFQELQAILYSNKRLYRW